MFTTLLALTLLATPEDPVRLAALGLRPADISAEKATFFSEFFAQQLVLAGGLKVTTPEQVAAVLGLERQRELLGCSDDSTSCLAEIAGALDAEGVVTGSIARVGAVYAINVQVVNARSGEALAIASGQLSREEDVLEWLSSSARAMAGQVRRKLGRTDVPAAASAPVSATEVRQSAGTGARAWVPAAAGAALVAGGGVFYLLALQNEFRLVEGDSSIGTREEALEVAQQGKTFEALGIGMGVAGIAAVAVGAGMWLFSPPSNAGAVNVAVMPSRDGAVAAVGGRF